MRPRCNSQPHLAPARLRSTARPDSFRCAMNTDTSKHGPGENGYAIINQFSGDTCALGTGLKKTIRRSKNAGIRKEENLVPHFLFRIFDPLPSFLFLFPFFRHLREKDGRLIEI